MLDFERKESKYKRKDRLEKKARIRKKIEKEKKARIRKKLESKRNNQVRGRKLNISDILYQIILTLI